ncbi:uncharacterized protein [Rutidosis leptorrhynchoides]|uniref:uncharacterized protein n=1 Tax=Rutidosis leptorrhynchoides TaxID=125765 RepID=UPI003A9A36B3
MMKSCELCKLTARIYCDSDQAYLCWTCDTKVHSANFLVARHSRNLLCRVCQSPTPWTASGERLGPSAVSVCDKCVFRGTSGDREEEESHGVNDVSVDDDDEYDADEDGEIELDNDDDDDGDDDIQVVPLCCTPPPAASSSSCDDNSVLVKRKRENVLLTDLSSSEDDVDCCSEVRGKKATLYQFLPSSSEEKMRSSDHLEEISGEKRCEEAVGVCKDTRAVGLDLNLLD